MEEKKTWYIIICKVLPFVSLTLLLLLWTYASSVNSRIVSPPTEVADKLIKLTTSTPVNRVLLLGHVMASFRRVLLGLFFAMLVGIPLGVMFGWNKYIKASLGSLFELIRPIPPIAWMPIIIMWLGTAEVPKVTMVFVGAMMPIVVNTTTGIRLTDPLFLNVGRMFNMKYSMQLLFEVAIPSALPSIFAGIRNATSTAFIVVLAAEMLSSKDGLGYLITRGMEFFDVPLIMAGMLVIGACGALLGVITNLIERWVCPWSRRINQD